MGSLSGIKGAVTGAKMIRNWSIDYDGSPQEFINSGTYVAKGRLKGNKDWSGKYEAHGGQPVSMPGEALDFQGFITADVGAQGTVIIDSVDINWDQEAAAIIAHTVNFSGNGDLTRGDPGTIPVASVADPLTSIGCKAYKNVAETTPAFATEIEDIRSMSLHIEAANVAYTNSGTSGGVRRAKGPIDASCSINVHTAAFSTLIAENTILGIRLHTAAATYWEIRWMIFGGASGLMVDRETHAIVGATLNGNLTYVTPLTDGENVPTKGHILLPNAAHDEWTFQPA